MLLGPRRVGKTVLIQQAMADLLEEGVASKAVGYFSVDHPIYTGLSLDALVKLFEDASG